MNWTKDKWARNPLFWFGMLMALFFYASGTGAFRDGQTVIGICAMGAGAVTQYAVIRLAGRGE